MLPVIGLTCDVYEGKMEGMPRCAVEYLPRSYFQGVAAAGGVPILLSNLEGSSGVEGLVDLVDGLIFTGGGDLDPAFYGESPEAKMRIVPERDRFELFLLRAARERGVPILGICRGMQLINVALGGSLHQDLPGHDRESLDRQRFHPVSVNPGSMLHQILGLEDLTVNTSHHQAVKEVAPGLKAVAWAKDGVVEGIEGVGSVLLVGVQWHPEIMEERASKRLFQCLVRASEERRWAKQSSCET